MKTNGLPMRPNTFRCAHYLVVLFILICTMALAQSKPEHLITKQKKQAQLPEVNPALSWLIGNWSGQGVQRGQQFASNLSVKLSLDGQALVFERSSEFGYKELFIVGYDQISKKYVAALFNNRNRNAVYTCYTGEKEFRLTQVTNSKAFSKRYFRLKEDGTLHFFIEQVSSDGKLKKVAEITFKKTA